MPTLAEVLDECRGLLVNIEIKNSPKDLDFDPDEAMAAGVVELLGARGGVDHVLVSSFHLPSIDRVHALAPDVADRVPHGDAARARSTRSAPRSSGGIGAVHPFFGVLADRAARDRGRARRTPWASR